MGLAPVTELRGDHAHPAVIEDIVTGLRVAQHVVRRPGKRIVGGDDSIPPERYEPGHVTTTALGGRARAGHQHAGTIKVGCRQVDVPCEGIPALLGHTAANRFADRKSRGGLLNGRGHPLVQVAAHVGPRHEFLGHDLRCFPQQSRGERSSFRVVAPVDIVERDERHVGAREILVGPDSLPRGRRQKRRAVVAEQRAILRAAVIPHRDIVQPEAFAGHPRPRQRPSCPVDDAASLVEMIGVEQGLLVDHEVIFRADRTGKTLETRAVASRRNVCLAEEHAEIPDRSGIPGRELTVWENDRRFREKRLPPGGRLGPQGIEAPPLGRLGLGPRRGRRIGAAV